MYDKLCVHTFNSFSLTRHAHPELSCTNKTKITWENSTVSGILQYRLYSLGYIYLCLQAQLSINFWWFWWLLWPLLEIGSLESVVVLKELRTDNKNFLVNQMTWIYHAIRGFFRGCFFFSMQKVVALLTYTKLACLQFVLMQATQITLNMLKTLPERTLCRQGNMSFDLE